MAASAGEAREHPGAHGVAAQHAAAALAEDGGALQFRPVSCVGQDGLERFAIRMEKQGPESGRQSSEVRMASQAEAAM